MYSIRSELLAAIRDLPGRFEPDELAYLAINAKVERPVQDRLAWSLHNRLKPFVVAREWHRADIAVLPETLGDPIAVLEIKAMLTFHAAKIPTRYDFRKFIPRDVAKSDHYTSPRTERYALLIGSNPKELPLAQWRAIVKYRQDMRAAIGRHGSLEAATAAGMRALEEDLPRLQLGPVESGKLLTGTAFGNEVELWWWLVGPSHKSGG